ncbi:MAG: NAD(P)/FAD-dependent oxidoreductase [Crocinitomicaceae bacterium]|nr:NAD(P)/FAD-dependent oxidoreductase [Crocinitomicaceae bacterium]
MKLSVKKAAKKRVVIIGGGFGGLQLSQSLSKSDFQVVLIDKNNYYQFQPLLYQVATCGLESTSIVFPFRKIFHGVKNFHFRLSKVELILPEENKIVTHLGDLEYDYLVLATGAGNNFFGNKNIEKYALPMKSLNESLHLRNVILERFEQALSATEEEQAGYLTFVVAGGGPTGTELAGALAEMKSNILPKDYPELDFTKMRIVLVEGGNRVLNAMHADSSEKAHHYLKELGVEIQLSTFVENYDGHEVLFKGGDSISTKTLIWSAGIKGNMIDGLCDAEVLPGNRLKVDEYNQVIGYQNIFAIGDIACMQSEENPKGHPQMAQPAIQQGKNLAKNLIAKNTNQSLTAFRYKNLGAMATVGRNKAVVELPKKRFGGFLAWATWMFVHLRSIFGIKNKWIIFINWVWNYFTYNSSLRLIIRRRELAPLKENVYETEM